MNIMGLINLDHKKFVTVTSSFVTGGCYKKNMRKV